MSYNRSPLSIRVDITTNPVANTTTVTQLLAAPGANKRYRIVALGAYLLQNEPAANVFRVQVSRGVGTVVSNHFWGVTLQVGAIPFGFSSFESPGISQISTNQALECQQSCTAASRPLLVIVHYFIDS